MIETIFQRYEEKYLINEKQLNILQNELMKHMDYDEYNKNGSFYQIFNIYFDTINDDIIINSISKPTYKEKLRIRAYKECIDDEDTVFLEIKKKYRGLVSKRRLPCSLKKAKSILNGEEVSFDSYNKNQIYKEIKYFLEKNKVKEKVYLSYERLAFVGKTDKTFRLTIDKNIITRRERVSLKELSYGRNLLKEKEYLMEVKISSSIPLWLVDVLSENKIYKTSYSKYGNEFKMTKKGWKYGI